MDRGLIVGAIAFVAAFAAERLYSSMTDDIARYEEMRKISGQPPILKELFSTVFGGGVDETGAAQLAGGFVSDLTNDVMRYAKMRNM
jgi:hypothetical protein